MLGPRSGCLFEVVLQELGQLFMDNAFLESHL